jgi:hypothetical protein
VLDRFAALVRLCVAPLARAWAAARCEWSWQLEREYARRADDGTQPRTFFSP